MKEPNTKQRMTPQRRVILEELRGRCDHPTADQLYDAVRGDMPHISLGTVYRNLDVLVRNGQAVRLEGAGSQARFDADTRPHYHVHCVACGAVGDVEAPALEPAVMARGAESRFDVTGVRIEFEGVCPHCRASGLE